MLATGIWHFSKDTKPTVYTDYLVIVAEKHSTDREWGFHVDSATPEFVAGRDGSIDGWQTLCDWDDDNALHILAWMDPEELMPNVDLTQYLPRL